MVDKRQFGPPRPEEASPWYLVNRDPSDQLFFRTVDGRTWFTKTYYAWWYPLDRIEPTDTPPKHLVYVVGDPKPYKAWATSRFPPVQCL